MSTPIRISITVGGSDITSPLGIDVKSIRRQAAEVLQVKPARLHLQMPLGLKLPPQNQPVDLELSATTWKNTDEIAAAADLLRACSHVPDVMVYLGGLGASAAFRQHEKRRSGAGHVNRLRACLERWRRGWPGGSIAIDALFEFPAASLANYSVHVLRDEGFNIVGNGRTLRSWVHWRDVPALWEDSHIRDLLAGRLGDGTGGEGSRIEDHPRVYWLNNAPPSEWVNEPWRDWNNPAIDKRKWTDAGMRAAWLEESSALAEKLGVELIGAGVSL